MKNIISIIVIIGFAITMLIPAYAEKEQTKESAQQQSSKQKKKKSANKKSVKQFIPSEKISADSSVSFPIDI